MAAVHHVVDYGLECLTHWWLCGGGVTTSATLAARHQAYIINGNVAELGSGIGGGENDLKISGHFINENRVLQPLVALVALSHEFRVSKCGCKRDGEKESERAIVSVH